MGKKKHKKKKKKQPLTRPTFTINSTPYPMTWGLSSFLEPTETPFLNYLKRCTELFEPKPVPLTDNDVAAAANAAEQIVRQHKKS